MDQGSPTSPGSLQSAHRLWNALGRPLKPNPPSTQYRRGWGSACADPKPIIATWTITFQDLNYPVTYLILDLTDNEEPLLATPDTCTTSALLTAHHRKPSTISKRLHRLTHAIESELMHLFRNSGWMDGYLKEQIEQVWRNCDICATSGLPTSWKKISVIHVN